MSVKPYSFWWMATLNLPKKIRIQQVMLKYEQEVDGNERGSKTVDIAHFGVIDAENGWENCYWNLMEKFENVKLA